MIINAFITTLTLSSILLTTTAISSTDTLSTVHPIDGEHKTQSIPAPKSLTPPPVKSNTELVEQALKYGMLADAYQKSPQGMITEGYRYQLRQLYLNWLPKALEVPGQTIEKANATIIRQWSDLLGQADYPASEKEQWVSLLANALNDWANKHQRQFFSLKDITSVMPVLKNKLEECNQYLQKPSSFNLKQNACHSMGSITRQVTSENSSTDSLNASMKAATYRFIESMNDTHTLPWYQEYLDSKSAFNDVIRERLDTGYSYQQLSQILQLAGIDYPIIYQHIRDFSLVHPQPYSE
ncbi:hypothetical protein [Endozoicomonas ascidiicola]|uniref:hypothetical protein n=1 Tax=Endozoicomonas ascidiicola TaxID=1698521 RepID=UPI00082D32C3|nr:hypothetical protein [Endozoicomonas ascidiicola]